jgi:hypothetical protein
MGDSLIIATESGIQVSVDHGLTWQLMLAADRGSPLNLFLDSKRWLWVSFATDTTISEANYLKGHGFAVFRAGAWHYLDQPKDPRTGYDEHIISVPVTTDINNITYDISETVDTLGIKPRRIWIASFAGSLRYIHADSLLVAGWQARWQLKTPTGDKLNVAQNDSIGFSQRLFSLAADNNRLWVGTANGIYYSTDFGDTFSPIGFNLADAASLSGNFVTYLNFSENYLHAMSLVVGAGETAAFNIAPFSPSVNAATVTFEHDFENERVFAAQRDNGILYVGHDDGLYVSDGGNWQLFKNFVDETKNVSIASKTVYSLLIDDVWWIGANDGLAYSSTSGQNWIVLKSKSILRSLDQNDHAAVYPSPFRPIHSNTQLSITFRQQKSGTTVVTFYDFSMTKVYELSDFRAISTAETITWDGKNQSGDYLSNGVYFVKIKTPSELFWKKVVVLN